MFPRITSFLPDNDWDNMLRNITTVFSQILHNSPFMTILLFLIYCYMPMDPTTGVRFPSEAGIFLFATASRPALGPTHPPIRWVLGVLSPGLKRPVSEVDHLYLHLLPKLRMCGSVPPYSQYFFMAW